jgi:hypothetical protein
VAWAFQCLGQAADIIREKQLTSADLPVKREIGNEALKKSAAYPEVGRGFLKGFGRLCHQFTPCALRSTVAKMLSASVISAARLLWSIRSQTRPSLTAIWRAIRVFASVRFMLESFSLVVVTTPDLLRSKLV